MKKTLLLLVAFITATIAFAQTEINGIYYNLNNSNQTAEVTYQYQWSSDNYSGVTSITIPEKVTFNSTEYSVTSIGEYAFYECSSLTSITIPNSVTSIGKYAFSECSNIAEIHISDIAKWCDIDFKGNSSNPLYNKNACLYVSGNKITELVIPEGVDSIKNYAFYNYAQLTSVTIPNSVTSIGSSAFSSCSSLTSITIPNSVTSIGNSAFSECSSLTSITIPNSVTSIRYQAFYSCSSLTSITIPNSVTSIGNSAFRYCSSLTSITCLGSTPPEASDLDAPTSTCTLIVPKEAYNSYLRHTYWGQFLTIRTIGDKEIKTEVNNSAWGKVNGAGVFNENETATLTAIPNNGYRFVKWDDEVTDNPRTVVVTQDSTFTAIFEPNTFTITIAVNNKTMGTVVGAGEYVPNSEVTLTATPAEGYHFVRWSDGVTEATRSIVVTDNITLTAEFAINVYTVTLSAENGAVTGNGEYNHGAEVTITAMPNEGYHFVKWSDGETNATRTITVTADVTLIAEFAINVYNVTLNTENGTVTGAGEYIHGTEVTLTATPNEGYHFVKWSDGETNATRTITVTADITLSAEFAINTYNVTLSAENGIVIGSGKYNYGTEIIIAVIANEDYRFSNWSDDNTENPRSIIVTKDISLEAILEIESPIIEEHNNFIVESANETHGNVKITITAEAIEGFEFDQWSDGNTENPRIVTLDEDIELYAYFRMAQGGTPVDLEISKISSANIYTTNGTLHIEGATTDYHILDAAGRLIYSGNATTLTLPRGIYLVTMGGEVEKIVL